MAEVWEDPFRWYELRDRGYVDFGRGFLGREVIRRVLSDMAATGLSFETVELSWRGDPLLHPEFVLILEDVLQAMAEKSLFTELRIVTDGRLLNTQIADVASKYDVPQTWVLHGNGVGECQEQVVRNFDYLLSVRHEKIGVVASWLLDEMIDPFGFIELWTERLKSPTIAIGRAPKSGDAIWFRRSDHDHFIGTKEANERLTELAEILDTPLESLEERASTRCFAPENSPTVSWDGKVTMCRWDREMKNQVGSVTDGKLSQIWSSGVEVHRRDAKGKGRPSNDLCRDCHYIHSPNV
jgi:radical SAM protein with 4Fe4S-binding SPASM domain